jgi:hypothetical protein
MHSGLRWENLQETNCLEDFDVELNVNVRLDLKQIHSETRDKWQVLVDPVMKSQFLQMDSL